MTKGQKQGDHYFLKERSLGYIVMSDNNEDRYHAPVYTLVTKSPNAELHGTLLANPMITYVYQLFSNKVLTDRQRWNLMRKYIPMQPKLLLSKEISDLYKATAAVLDEVIPDFDMATENDGHYSTTGSFTTAEDLDIIEDTAVTLLRGLRRKDADGNSIDQDRSISGTGNQRLMIYICGRISKEAIKSLETRIQNNNDRSSGGPTLGCSVFSVNTEEFQRLASGYTQILIVNPPKISNLANLCVARSSGINKYQTTLMQKAIDPLSAVISGGDLWRDQLQALQALHERVRYLIPSGEEKYFFPNVVKPLIYGQRMNLWASIVPCGTGNFLGNWVCTQNTNPSTSGLGYSCAAVEHLDNKNMFISTCEAKLISTNEIAVQGHSGTPVAVVNDICLVNDIPGDTEADYNFPNVIPVPTIPLPEPED